TTVSMPFTASRQASTDRISPSMKLNSDPPSSCAMLLLLLVARLSRQRTRAPFPTNASHTWLPMKPAPPVTRMFVSGPMVMFCDRAVKVAAAVRAATEVPCGEAGKRLLWRRSGHWRPCWSAHDRSERRSMSPQEWIVLSIMAVAMVLFISEKLGVDIVALLIILALALSGVLTPAEAIAGFSDPATLTVAFMFVLSAGLLRSGAISTLGPRLSGYF